MRRPLFLAGAATMLLAAVLAIAHEAGSATMFFGLFSKRLPSTVAPEVGAVLKREAAMPAHLPAPPEPAYAPVRRVAVSGLAPDGRITGDGSTDRTQPDGYLRDGVVVVNRNEGDHRTTLWQVDPRDPTRFGKPLNSAFEPDMSRWIMSWASQVIALPGGRLLVELAYHRPQPTLGLFLYDPATDRLTSRGRIEAFGFRGQSLSHVHPLQLRPDTVLVMHHTDRERLGAEHYVRHHDHLVLYSPKFPDGLPIAVIGIDDGNVMDWGLAGNTLWLRTSDGRERPAREFVWSLDLSRVL